MFWVERLRKTWDSLAKKKKETTRRKATVEEAEAGRPARKV